MSFCDPTFHLKAMIHISGNRTDFLKLFHISSTIFLFLSTFPSHITSFNVYYSMFLPTFKPRDVSLPSCGMLDNMHLYNMINVSCVGLRA